ncbi:unnamed protein product [Ixodes hexagonus]
MASPRSAVPQDEPCLQVPHRRFGSTDLMVPHLSYENGTGLIATESAPWQSGLAPVRRCRVRYSSYARWSRWSDHHRVGVEDGVGAGPCLGARFVGLHGGPEAVGVGHVVDAAVQSVGVCVAVRAGLGVVGISLLLVHDVEFAPTIDVILQETLPALETLRQAGITRYIGITGYPLQTLREVIERSPVKINVVLSYCRGTLFDQALLEYIPFFQSLGLGVANAAPLGMGLLTRGPPPSWHPATDQLKDACARAYAFCQACTESGVSLEKLGLGYSLYKFSGVHTTIVGMNSCDTLRENIDCIRVTKDEKTTAELLQRKFFQPLATRHWEGRELEKVSRKLAQQQ